MPDGSAAQPPRLYKQLPIQSFILSHPLPFSRNMDYSLSSIPGLNDSAFSQLPQEFEVATVRLSAFLFITKHPS